MRLCSSCIFGVLYLYIYTRLVFFSLPNTYKVILVKTAFCLKYSVGNADVIQVTAVSVNKRLTSTKMLNVRRMTIRSMSTATRSKASTATRSKASTANRSKVPTGTRSKAPKVKIPDYPFSKTAIISTVSSPPPTPLLQGKGLMEHLNKTLATPEKQEMFRKLFGRHSPNQIRPGSIIQLTLEHAPTIFTGVLLSIRRRGLDTSILLRNIIQRTGVEMQFFVNSPHVKDIKVLQMPPGGRMRRAKLFYLRDSPEKMSMIAGGRK